MRAYEIEVQQGGKEWHSLREGNITASCIHIIVSGTAQAKNTYLKYLLGYDKEKFALQNKKISSLWFIKRGKDLEDRAVANYALDTGVKTRKAGFFKHKELPIGGSPDRVALDLYGGVEIKCPESPDSHKALTHVGLPEVYFWQCLTCAWLLDCPTWDFYSWHPDFESIPRKMKFLPSDIKTLENKIDEFLYYMREKKLYKIHDVKKSILDSNVKIPQMFNKRK